MAELSGMTLWILSPACSWDASLPIAASRAGAVGLLDLTHCGDPQRAVSEACRLARLARNDFGAVLEGRLGPTELAVLESVRGLDTLLFTSTTDSQLAELLTRSRPVARHIGVIATNLEQARSAEQLGFDLIIAKGQEAGGFVGRETAQSLLDQFRGRVQLPIHVWGGVDISSLPTYRDAGAAGLVFDCQFALARECHLSAELRRHLEAEAPPQTAVISLTDNLALRVLNTPNNLAVEELRTLASKRTMEGSIDDEACRAAVTSLLSDPDAQPRLWPVGLDAACARPWSAAAPTVAGMLARLRDAAPGSIRVLAEAEPPVPAALDIAIVGMSCLLPGAVTLDQLWQNILERRDVITRIPSDRFDAEQWFDPQSRKRDKINSQWGGFLPEVPFDPFKFGIPPNALRSIEPSQLLALELVDRALADAGGSLARKIRDRTSVVFGISGGLSDLGGKYLFRSLLPQYVENPGEEFWGQLPEWTEDSFAGILPNVLAGRICNRFDFGGANFTVDAACASSLAAVYLGSRMLADGSSDLVIAGGCDTVQNQFAYLCFAQSGALSPRGRSRTFDAGSDGIAISEGLAAIVLKRRADAERDGDRIYAVLRGVAAGSDGKSKGMTAPRKEGQIRTLERAYRQTGFSPATVGLFEAHGTGTELGDATECQSLGEILRSHGAQPQSCAIGSIKSLIGHTKSTAGIAGLIKASLALHYKVRPGTLHVERPSPKADLETGPLYVNTELRPWIAGPTNRRAAVSAFGFGGTNFHAVLEEYADGPLPVRRELTHRDWPAELFLFAATSPAELASTIRETSSELQRVLDAGAQPSLANLAWTHFRKHSTGGAHRAAVVATSVTQLMERFAAAASAIEQPAGRCPAGVFYTQQPLGQATPLTFLFPGQGAQSVNMLRDLAVEFAEVQECFAAADRTLAGRWDRPLSELIYPPPAFSDDVRQQQTERLKNTEVAQPALGVVGLALARLLASFGIRPQLTAGHSYGELPALATAGCLTDQDLFQLSWARGNTMAAAAKTQPDADAGAMLAVETGRAALEPILAQCPGVSIANHNSPKQIVLTGVTAGIQRAAELCRAQGLGCMPLSVSAAFHSPLMQTVRSRFDEILAAVAFRPQKLPVYSNVSAAAYPVESSAVRELLSQQLVNEVRFVDEVQSLYDAGARVFLELGPHPVVSKFVATILKDRPHVAVACQTRDGHGLVQLLQMLGTLYAHGVAVSCDRLYEGRRLTVLDNRGAESTKASATSPHNWLVDGGNARPATEPRKSPVPVQLHAEPQPNEKFAAVNSPLPARNAVSSAPPPSSSVPNTHASAVVTRAPMNAAPPAPSLPAPVPAPAPLPGAVANRLVAAPPRAETPRAEPTRTVPVADTHDPYVQFQQTMRQFLSMQERVLTAYWGDGSVTSAAPLTQEFVAPPPRLLDAPAPLIEPVPAPLPLAEPIVAATKPLPLPAASQPVIAAPPVAPPAAAQHQPVPPLAELEHDLIKIVSERTGYPLEMLNVQADLEGDLGVDSIKRVEIIGAFRRHAMPHIANPPAAFMESMTTARTLRAIASGVLSLLTTESTAAPVAITQPLEQTPPVTAPAYTDESLAALLLKIVAERTGYPPGMLNTQADLEGDLGIDSIKRVEIIGAFRQAVLPAQHEPPAGFMEAMSKARTLEAMCQGVKAVLGLDPAPPDSAAALPLEQPVAATREAPALGQPVSSAARYVARVVAAPPVDDAPLDLPAGTLVLTDDGAGTAARLQAEIVQRGGRAALLSSADLSSRESTAAALDRIRHSSGSLGGFVHLLPLQPAKAYPGLTESEWNTQVDLELKSLLFLLQACSSDFRRAGDQRMVAACVTLWGGDYADSKESDAQYAWRGGVAGMLKTAAKEFPQIRCRAVDVDDIPTAGMLLTELASAGPVEIGYRDGRRLTIVTRPEELTESHVGEPEVQLDRHSVVVLTGGAQGITAEIAREFARRTQAKLILLGRSAAPRATEDAATAGIDDLRQLRSVMLAALQQRDAAVTPRAVEAAVKSLLKERQIRRTLADLQALGSTAEYIPCDVRNGAVLEAALRDVVARHGGIDAVLHGAGLIEDALIDAKTPESFDRVLGTKLSPMHVFSRVLDADRLQLLMLFSSVAGFCGNAGQVDYAAANEILNRLARRLRDLGAAKKVVAMNWGPWDGGGMVTPELAASFAAQSIGLVPVAGGTKVAWLETVHAAGEDVRVLIGQGPWSSTERAVVPPLDTSATPLLAGQAVERREGGVEARVVLDAGRQPFLRDHRIDQTPVLAFAVAVELMAETAFLAHPNWHVTEINDVRMYSGVVLKDDRRELLIRAEQVDLSTSRGEWLVRISDAKRPARPLYEAMVVLAADRPAAPLGPPIDRIADPPHITAAEAYDRWLFHGPVFQVIEELRGLNARGIDAIVRPASVQNGLSEDIRSSWLVDPMVLDAAPQLAIVWSRATYDTTPLPSRIANYRQYATMGDEPLEMLYRVDADATEATHRATVWLIRHGQVIGRIEGLESAGSTELNRVGSRN